MRIGNVPFVVVGLLEHKGRSPGGYDLDDNSYVPFTTYVEKVQGGLRQYVTGSELHQRGVAADAGAAAEQVTELLRDRHHIVDGWKTTSRCETWSKSPKPKPKARDDGPAPAASQPWLLVAASAS